MTDLAFALSLADIADAVTVPFFRSPDLSVRTKADLSPVSEADTATEQAIRAAISERFPDDAIFGEEFGGFSSARTGREWIIDPIDGTANFVRGVPIWGTLISLVIDGVPEIGVVSCPALGRRWFAAAGQGAHVIESVMGHDGTPRRIHVSSVDNLADAYLSFNGFSYWQSAGKQNELIELIDATERDRAIGDFWAYMLVAEGVIDIVGEWGVQPYDLGAVDIVVREAGGCFTGMDGTPGIWGGSALASNGLIQDAALDIVRGK